MTELNSRKITEKMFGRLSLGKVASFLPCYKTNEKEKWIHYTKVV